MWRGEEGLGRHKKWNGETHQIREGIQLLAHQATLLPPPRHPPVHEVEEQAKGQEGEREVQQRSVGGVAEAVAEGREDGEDAAKAWKALASGLAEFGFSHGACWDCPRRERTRGGGETYRLGR